MSKTQVQLTFEMSHDFILSADHREINKTHDPWVQC